MLNVVIIGASGYVGVELVYYLHCHRFANIVGLFVSKESIDVGKKISDVHKQFKGIIDLILHPLHDPLEIIKNIDVVFFATDHLVSHDLVPIFLSYGICVFDLSGAFRIKNIDIYEQYYNFKHQSQYWLDHSIYGLAEWNQWKIKKGQLISVPGCYATAVQLGLKPIIEEKAIDVNYTPVINAISGVTGSGRKATMINSFCEVSLQPYNIFIHRHQPEIISHLGVPVIFIPHLGSFSRGILATITCVLKPNIKNLDVTSIFYNAYAEQPCIRLYDTGFPSIKSVLGLPFCDIGLTMNGKNLVIVVAIDNLLKGAASQAIQCFNIRFQFTETLSLI
ncbi:N-acetyl-gamma-glutamyl-phosphate reductase [Buchnera aphidicola (Hormaphis cornu)]|nr:N-acetyl-gamma-glutamyl-phosphate reductase [Buchnera aphidicola (Hormaphis cornu)]